MAGAAPCERHRAQRFVGSVSAEEDSACFVVCADVEINGVLLTGAHEALYTLCFSVSLEACPDFVCADADSGGELHADESVFVRRRNVGQLDEEIAGDGQLALQ